MGVAVAVAGQHRVGVACAPSYMRERGEARRMGVAVAVAWQHQEGVACVPSYRRAQQRCAAPFSRGRARRMGVAVASLAAPEGVACVPSYMREARPDEWASQSLWPGSAGLALHVCRATR